MLQKYLILGLIVCCHIRSVAQAPIDNIIQQMPAPNPQVLEQNMVNLAEMGAVGVVDLASRLRSKSDQAARYALSGLAKYAGGAAMTQRESIEKGFLEALRNTEDVELRVFLLDQLQYLGTRQSIPVLRGLISSLCDPAIRTLTQIGGPEALDVLIASYDGAGDFCKRSLINAMAQSDDPRALQQLEKIASAPGSVPASHVMPLLAAKGSNTSKTLLEKFKLEQPSLGTMLLLKHAGKQAQQGKREALLSMAAPLIKSYQGAQSEQAIDLVASYGGDAGQKLLLKSLKKSGPKEASAIVAQLANRPQAPMAGLLKSMKKLDGTGKVQVLHAAARQGAKSALPQARSLIKSADPQVAKAAISALSSIQGKASLPDLQNVLQSTSNPGVVQVITQELFRWIDAENMQLVGTLIDQSKGIGKANLLAMVAERGLTQFYPQVKSALSSNNTEVRQEAFATLPALAHKQKLDDLVTIAPMVNNDDERAYLVQAISAQVGENTDRDLAVGEVIRLIGGAPQIIQGVLPKVGGQVALQHINQTYAGDPTTRKEILLSWEHPEALGQIIAMARDEGMNPAILQRIISLSNHADLPGDQKLLYLREVMPLLNNGADRHRLLAIIGQVRTPTAFSYVSQYLDDEELRTTAAGVLVNIALPPAGERYGLVGPVVRQKLLQADTILAGTDQDYTRAFVQNYLTAMPDGAGYVSLFNGVDLTGWKGLVGNPITRDTMFGLERQTQQREVNRTLPERWQVQDGVLVYTGDAYDNLCTDKDYRDFELVLDWKIEKDADSGIYLRGSPQVQIWDPTSSEEQNEVGSGGLFNNKVHESKPLVLADNPVGEWNTFRIIMIDDKVSVYLNGQLVTDNQVLENYWNRELPIFRRGQIELQAHTTKIYFRDIFIKELEGAPEISSIETRQGFKPLFNGINLDGWVGNKTDYVAENGELVIYPGPVSGQGNLYTQKEYENFRLRFEFKLTPGANNGLGIHAPLKGDAAYLGKELQILDNTAEKYANLKPYQFHGSAYGLVPARKGALKPVGEWNDQEVIVKGNRITVILNNQRILSADLDSATRNGTLDGKEHPGLKRLRGHIGFLGHGDQVHFRNIRILELETAE